MELEEVGTELLSAERSLRSKVLETQTLFLFTHKTA